MRRASVAAVFGILCAGCAQARVWKSSAGTELDAEYVRQAYGMVTLKTQEGKQVTVPAAKLSEEDQTHLRELLAKETPGAATGASASAGTAGLRSGAPAGGETSAGDPAVVATLKPGQTVTRTADGDTKISYVVYAPANFTTNGPMPLIVAFSPGGNGKQMVDALKESADKRGWLLVGCNALKNSMPDEALETKMEDEVLDDIFKKLPHDRRRVYYAGFSGGDNRSYHLTARRTEPIAGIVAYGGWIGGEKFYKLPFRKGMAVAMVNGANDEAANSWANRDAPPLKKRNCEVKAFDFPGGHQLPPKETTEASLQWIDEEWTKQSLKK